MKKTITLLLALFLITSPTFAEGNWATCAISISKDGGPAIFYRLNDEGWTDGDWITNTFFSSHDFGTPTSLKLNGAAGNAWTDDSPGYTTSSFVLYYRVYKVTETPGGWSHINLDNLAYNSGNNYIFDKTASDIDLLNYVLSTPTPPQNAKGIKKIAPSNLYYIEVVISKNQYYIGGNWNSMIPGDQRTAYNPDASGFKATFTKSISTDVSKIDSELKISTVDGEIRAKFNGNANIELFSITGQSLVKKLANNTFNQSVKEGIYFLRINGKTHKVIVK